MARPLGFDRHEFLDASMQIFWAKGYSAVSIHDLVEATGVNRASIYASFGDKASVFRASLEHYLATVSSVRLRRLEEAGSVKTAIRRYFDELVDFSADDPRRLGCLLINTAVELAPHHPEIEALVRKSFSAVEAAFARAIRRGQKSGEIPPHVRPGAMARFLLNVVQGLRVSARTRPDRKALHEIVTHALSGLD